MVVKIPDPTSRTRPSAELTSLPTIPSGGSSNIWVKTECTQTAYKTQIKNLYVKKRRTNLQILEYKKYFFSVQCIIPLFHPPIGVYTRYFLTLGAIMDFSRVQREKSIIARLDIYNPRGL